MDENRMQCEEQIELEKKSKRPKASIIILSILILGLSVLCIFLAIELSSDVDLGDYECFIWEDGTKYSDYISSDVQKEKKFTDKSKLKEEITFQLGMSEEFTGTYSHSITSKLDSRYENYYVVNADSISESEQPTVALRSDGSIACAENFVIDTFDFSLKFAGIDSFMLDIPKEELRDIIEDYFEETFDFSIYNIFSVDNPDWILPIMHLEVDFKIHTLQLGLNDKIGEYIHMEFRFKYEPGVGCGKAELVYVCHYNAFDDKDTSVQEHYDVGKIPEDMASIKSIIQNSLDKCMFGSWRVYSLHSPRVGTCEGQYYIYIEKCELWNSMSMEVSEKYGETRKYVSVFILIK